MICASVCEDIKDELSAGRKNMMRKPKKKQK